MLPLILLGVCTGMRSMTPIAVVCWFCWMDRFPVHGTWAFWAAYLVSAILFALFAVGEYVGDTLPSTPNRTALGPAAARLVFGGLVAAIAGTAYLLPVPGSVLFGVVGAAIGTWGGFYARRYLSRKVGRDLPVALVESAITLGLSIYLANRWAESIAMHPAFYR